MTIWTYYRVSSDKQDYNSQKVGVLDYCLKNNLKIDKEVIDDGISGSVEAKKRNFKKILREAVKGDVLIVSELSRIGRSTIDVLDTCKKLSEKGVEVYLIKQGLKLDNSATGKMMLAIFSAFAELERDLIIQRTREGLTKARQQGKKLGRPFGFTYCKLNKDKEKNIKEINKSLEKGVSIYKLYKSLHVGKPAFYRFCEQNNIILNIEKKNG